MVSCARRYEVERGTSAQVRAVMFSEEGRRNKKVCSEADDVDSFVRRCEVGRGTSAQVRALMFTCVTRPVRCGIGRGGRRVEVRGNA